ncbi:MAG: molybdopterin converting factor subunit 1 [Moraxellaceae bacterium]
MSTANSTVSVLFFARHREQMGMADCVLSLAAPISLAEFKQQLTAQYPAFASLRQPVMAAVNQDFADDDRLIQAGDEVAFFPPVTGG